jgi:RNA polymerase sigma factor (sigma-70 family)
LIVRRTENIKRVSRDLRGTERLHHWSAYAPDTTSARSRWIREVDEWFAGEIFPYERMLVRLARRITEDEEAAREIVHEVYAYLLKNDLWRTIRKPRAYVIMAVRRASMRFANRGRIVAFSSFADMDVFSGDGVQADAHQVLFAKEQRRLVLEIIEGLPPRCREVVRLRRFDDRSPTDIADQLGISLSVVNKHLARGMAIIAEQVSAMSRCDD